MSGRYSDEEVEAIFRLALERQAAEDDGFGRDELVEAALEVGLDEDSVDRAIAELESERSEGRLYERVKAKQRERWLRHLVTYLVVVGGFVGMNLLGFVGAWVAWMAFGWGIALALQTFRVLRGPSEQDVEKERVRLNRRARREAKAAARREARQARRRRKAEEVAAKRARKARSKQTGEELERVIEEGVALLLGAAAKKLREATEQAEVPDTEFNRYVATKKGRAPAAPVVTPPPRATPRARVAVDELAHEDDAEPADEGQKTAATRGSRRRRR